MILSSRFDHCEKSAVLPGGDYNEKGLAVLFEAESPREPLSGPQGTAGLLGDGPDSQDHQGISMRYDASMYSGGSPETSASLTTMRSALQPGHVSMSPSSPDVSMLVAHLGQGKNLVSISTLLTV